MNPIYSYYVDIKFALLQQMPNILISFSIVLGSWIIQHYIIKNLLKRLAIHYGNKQMEFKKEICEHISKPTRNFIFATGLLVACGYALNESIFTYQPLFKIFKTMIIFFFFQSVYYVTNYFGEHPDALKTKFNLKAENVLFPFLHVSLKYLFMYLHLR